MKILKIALIVVFFLIATAIALMFFLGQYSQDGQAPGLVNGSLTKCPEKPNCVSSEQVDDVEHYIKPIINIENIGVENVLKVVSIIEDMNGVVQSKKDNYIAATFTSSTFGFVDDFEIRINPKQGTLHFRSASRVGYRDAGVNRKRVELFKVLFDKK